MTSQNLVDATLKIGTRSNEFKSNYSTAVNEDIPIYMLERPCSYQLVDIYDTLEWEIICRQPTVIPTKLS